MSRVDHRKPVYVVRAYNRQTGDSLALRAFDGGKPSETPAVVAAIRLANSLGCHCVGGSAGCPDVSFLVVRIDGPDGTVTIASGGTHGDPAWTAAATRVERRAWAPAGD